MDSAHLDTSDYHSATSSDCGSAASSDTEEEAKDYEEAAVKKEAGEANKHTITMVPRIRKRHGEGPSMVKYVRNMVITENADCSKKYFPNVVLYLINI